MKNIKELTDFYIWMKEHNFDSNIRSKVEEKAEIYLSNINVRQDLSLSDDYIMLCGKFELHSNSSSATKCKRCGREKWQHPC